MLLLENMKKTNFKEKSKTTSALTCLVGAILLFNQTGANAITSVGTMSVTTTVANVCSITSTELTFGAYDNLGSTKDSTGGGVISTNCSGAISHILSVTELSSTGVYKMLTSGAADASREITFKLYISSAAGTQVSDGVAFKTATGTGGSVAVATLFGVIQAGNTGKESGSYTKSIALNAVYN
jgi:spore coat protein U-like protein